MIRFSVKGLSTLTTLLVLCLLSPDFASAEETDDRGSSRVAFRSIFGAQMGQKSLTVWSDGYVEDVVIGFGQSRHWSGKLDATARKALLKTIKESGLSGAKFRQKSDPTLLTEGGGSVAIWTGKKLQSFSPPRVGEYDAHSKALLERLRKIRTQVAKLVKPFLSTAGKAGSYVCASLHSQKSPDPAAIKKAKLSPSLSLAVSRPGAYVLLPKGHTVKHGASFNLSGVKGDWLVWKLGHKPCPKQK